MERIHALGADVAALVVDSPERNAAHARRWHIPFPIHSDPGGEHYLQPLDLWNPHERGGIGWPAVLIVDRSGREVERLRCRDFADRPPDDSDVFAALERLGLPAIEPPPPWQPEVEPVEDPGALRVDAFGPYMRGIRFGVLGLASRLVDDADVAEAHRMSAMAASFLDAWSIRRKTANG
jgi:hypothetical protein